MNECRGSKRSYMRSQARCSQRGGGEPGGKPISDFTLNLASHQFEKRCKFPPDDDPLGIVGIDHGDKTSGDPIGPLLGYSYSLCLSLLYSPCEIPQVSQTSASTGVRPDNGIASNRPLPGHRKAVEAAGCLIVQDNLPNFAGHTIVSANDFGLGI